jgi:uncharacterized protein YjbJ (UPF0337 family)
MRVRRAGRVPPHGVVGRDRRGGQQSRQSRQQADGQRLWSGPCIKTVITRKEAHMAGLGDKIAGKGKELEGKATGDKARETQGKAQGARGKLKDKGAKAKKDLAK